MEGYITRPINLDKLPEAIQSLTTPGSQGRPPSEPEPPLISSATGPVVFDKQELLDQLDGDLVFAGQLVNAFLSKCPRHLSQIQSAIRNNNPGLLRQEAHALKGALATLRADRATDAARRIEDIARSGDMSATADAYSNLIAEIDLLKESLAPVQGVSKD